MEYPIFINKLSEQDGGGYQAVAFDLMGCIGVGETPLEALVCALSAIDEWIDEAKALGREIPLPGSAGRRAEEEHKKLLQVVKDLSALDHKIDALVLEVDELKLEYENAGAWDRCIVLTGLGPTGSQIKQLT